MLVIRFFRVGKKNQPSFKIVVTDKRKPPRAGRFVEEVGFYNPKTKEKVLKAERIKYWLSVGAKPSGTAYNLLISEKIIEGKKIASHKKPKEEAKEVSTAAAPIAEKPVPEKPAEEKPAEEKPTQELPKEEKLAPASADLSAEAQGAKTEATAIKEEKPKEESPGEEKEKPAEKAS